MFGIGDIDRNFFADLSVVRFVEMLECDGIQHRMTVLFIKDNIWAISCDIVCCFLES